MAQSKVLIIDDEKLLVKSTSMGLKCYNFEPEGALDGLEGLLMAEKIHPDIILLDIMMPGIDGWQVLERLKGDDNLKDIPVVIFTAKEYSNGKSEAELKGAVDFIQKPFELDELVALLKKHTEKTGD
jgi:DNA-binding response OmpR family regulator